jgi:hypothetical protein
MGCTGFKVQRSIHDRGVDLPPNRKRHKTSLGTRTGPANLRIIALLKSVCKNTVEFLLRPCQFCAQKSLHFWAEWLRPICAKTYQVARFKMFMDCYKKWQNGCMGFEE